MHREKQSPSIQWTHTQTVPQGGVFPALPYKAESKISTPTLRDTGAADRKMLPAWPGNVEAAPGNSRYGEGGGGSVKGIPKPLGKE